MVVGVYPSRYRRINDPYVYYQGNSQFIEWCTEMGIEVGDPLPIFRLERNPVLRLGRDYR
ncbi:MAG: hypothetical protein GY769_19855 [bacterium]|nr:hypothetical protein [bacterium]